MHLSIEQVALLSKVAEIKQVIALILKKLVI